MHIVLSSPSVFADNIFTNILGGKNNGSKNQIKKNGTEEGTFL